MRAPLTALALLVLAMSACATSPLDRLIDQGRFTEAVRTFENDSSLHASERALYLAAVLHARPRSATYDPGRARELLSRLVLLHPESSYGSEALRLLPLLAEIEAQQEQAARRQRQASSRMKAVEAEIASLRRHNDWLTDRFESKEGETAILQDIIARLEQQIRDRDLEVQGLREELDRLKQIDLRTARPTEEVPPDSLPVTPDSASTRP